MRQGFIAEGTTCNSCREIIKRQAMKVDGVTNVTFDLKTESGFVTFDEKKTDIDQILDKIEEKGYKCYIMDEKPKNSYSWVPFALGIVVIGFFLFRAVEGVQFPSISPGMGYGLLFLVGLLTGFHCIGMCGGFVVGYTASSAKKGKSPYSSHAQYAIGKTLSYTIIGAAFGLLGSIIAFTPGLRGTVGILAGIFLLLYGLRMLDVIPQLRGFGIHRLLPKGFRLKGSSSPLVIGLLNGLMIACGPLQAIYIMAAGTGSVIEGAKLLLVFALGTLPAMIGFGFFASYVSAKFTKNMLKISGGIVMILGLFMINNGLALTGQTVLAAPDDGLESSVADGVQEIRMEVTAAGWSPDTFVLKKGVPVRWVIDGKEITGCNNAIQVPAYGLEFDIVPGEQVIEFTPDEEGVIRWSCWMGMIPGTFVVKEDTSNAAELVEQYKPVASSGCGCGGHA